MSSGRIAAIELHHCQVTPRTTWSFVEVRLADGATGWGEATLSSAPHTLDVPAAAARAALCGRRMEDLPRLADAAFRPMAEAAIASALEQAAWDLRGRRLGCSAARLDDAQPRDRIPLYANINRRTVDRSPAGFAHSARFALAAGYRALKIAPFDGVTPAGSSTPEGRAAIDLGLARTAAVRAAAGADAELQVDCHWRFDARVAPIVLRELVALGVTWFECPLAESAEHMPALRALRGQANAIGVRLAGLEELTHPDAFLPWLEAGCYDVVMPDVKYAGGIGGLLRVAELARDHGVSCAPHNPSGPIAHAASLIACAIADDMEVLEHQFDETPAFFDVVDGGLPRPHDGASALPEGPGLGVALRRG